jgi:hypothetical protein
MWQFVNVGLLTLLDMTTSESVFSENNQFFTVGIITMVACQMIHLVNGSLFAFKSLLIISSPLDQRARVCVS